MRKNLVRVVGFSLLLFLAGCQSKTTETRATQGQQGSSQPSQQPLPEGSLQARPGPTGGPVAATGRPGSAQLPPAQLHSGAAPSIPAGAASPSQLPPSNEKAQSTVEPPPAVPRQPSGKQQVKPPAQPIVVMGAPMGGVRFEHSKHPLDCDTCHHSARDPKPGSAPQQACTSCHTKPPQPGMKTGKQAAFHNATATAGTCIDCHKKSGGAAPTKCMQCHRKENT